MMNQYDYTNVLKMMPERGASSILRETQIVCYTLSDFESNGLSTRTASKCYCF